MHNNIDKNKQIRKYYLHIVIFADFMPFRVLTCCCLSFYDNRKTIIRLFFTTTETTETTVTTVTTYNV